MALVELTEGQTEARDRESAPDWDTELGPDAFVARERTLRRTAFGRSRAGWGWTVSTALEATCETYERRWRGGLVWLVASVWTPPGSRGRGHASRLLQAVAERCAARPGAGAMILFSDVGAALYERVGYVALPAIDVAWPAEPGDPDDGPWQRFAESAVPTLSPRDGEQLEWQLDRARTRAELVPTRRPARCGARLPSGEWMVWTDEDGALRVLEATARTSEAWAALATAAARTAAAVGLPEVVAWDPGPLAGGLRRPRRGKLAMVRSFGPPLDDFLPIDRAAWV